MRPSPTSIVRGLIAASLLVPLLAVATPAQAGATPLIDAKLRSIRLMDNGSLQVVIEYVCPSRDRYRVVPRETRVGISQPRVDDESAWVHERFHEEVVCDGTPQVLLKRLRPEERPVFHRRFLLHTYLSLLVGRHLRPSLSDFQTQEMQVFRINAGGKASAITDIDVNYVRLSDGGVLLVVLDYHCPTGWYVDPEEDGAGVSATARMRGGTWASFGNRVRDIICDGQTRTIVKRMNPDTPLTRRVMTVTVSAHLNFKAVGATSPVVGRASETSAFSPD